MVAKLSQTLKDKILKLRDAREIRLFLAMIACSTAFYRIDSTSRQYRMPARQMFEKVKQSNYKILLETFEGLCGSSLLDRAASNNQGGMLHWQFSESTRAALDTLRSDDIAINLDLIAGLTTAFELKLYLMCHAYKAVKKISRLRITVSLDQLAADFGVPDFGRYDNFKTRILLPAGKKLVSTGALDAVEIAGLHARNGDREVSEIRIRYTDSAPTRRAAGPGNTFEAA